MDQSKPDVEALLTEIGRTLLLWGLLETQMIEARFDWKRSPGIVDPQDPDYPILRDLETPRAVRNALAHGIKKASANPWSDIEARVICRTFDGGDRPITFSELRLTQAEITRLRRMFPQVSTSSEV